MWSMPGLMLLAKTTMMAAFAAGVSTRKAAVNLGVLKSPLLAPCLLF